MIKIHLVSGFLGAGKTTLIKKILKLIKGKKLIIENEFGEVGIDGEIIKEENYDVIELANGCICCSIKANFEETLLSAISEYNPEHIIIEPTGIGMLSDILEMLNKKEIRDRCTIMTPITVVDILSYFEQVEVFGDFYKNQISNAGIIVLSRTDLIEGDYVNKVIESIREFNKHAEIIHIDWSLLTEIDYNELINTEMDLHSKEIKFVEELSNVNKDIQSFSVVKPKTFSIKSLEDTLDKLKSKEFGDVIRAKGFVLGEDGSLEFSYVNGRYTITKNNINNSNRICVIGRKLDNDALSKILVD